MTDEKKVKIKKQASVEMNAEGILEAKDDEFKEAYEESLAKEKAAEEEMELYSDAVNAVSNMLTENGKAVQGARICDISFVNTKGEEIFRHALAGK